MIEIQMIKFQDEYIIQNYLLILSCQCSYFLQKIYFSNICRAWNMAQPNKELTTNSTRTFWLACQVQSTSRSAAHIPSFDTVIDKLFSRGDAPLRFISAAAGEGISTIPKLGICDHL
jgi:hypothetical protein